MDIREVSSCACECDECHQVTLTPFTITDSPVVRCEKCFNHYKLECIARANRETEKRVVHVDHKIYDCINCSKKNNEQYSVECMYCNKYTCIGCRVMHANNCTVRNEQLQEKKRQQINRAQTRIQEILYRVNSLFNNCIRTLLDRIEWNCKSINRKDINILPRDDLVGTTMEMSSDELEIRKFLTSVFDKNCISVSDNKNACSSNTDQPPDDFDDSYDDYYGGMKREEQKYDEKNNDSNNIHNQRLRTSLIELRKLLQKFNSFDINNYIFSVDDNMKLKAFVNGIKSTYSQFDNKKIDAQKMDQLISTFSNHIKTIIGKYKKLIINDMFHNEFNFIENIIKIYDQIENLCISGMKNIDFDYTINKCVDLIRERLCNIIPQIQEKIKITNEEITRAPRFTKLTKNVVKHPNIDMIRQIPPEKQFSLLTQMMSQMMGGRKYQQRETEDSRVEKLYKLISVYIILEKRRREKPNDATTLEEAFERVANLRHIFDEKEIIEILKLYNPFTID